MELSATCGTLFYFCHLISMLTRLDCYNLDVSSAIFKSGPSGSHFGRSVTSHLIFNTSTRSQIPILLVGAAHFNELKSSKSCSLYFCFVSDSQTEENCQQIPFLSSEFERNDDIDCAGVVVASQGVQGGVAMACAEYMGGATSCVLLTNDLIAYEVWNPCDNDETDDQYGGCHPGFSVFMDKKNITVVGIPGHDRGEGIVISRPIANSSIQTRIGNPSNIFSDSYFGMSVSVSDKIFRNKLTYLIGAPRSPGNGEVYLMLEDSGKFKVVLTLRGHQMASNFGYKVTSADLNGDGQDEVLIAAPTFYDSQSCGGAVYVYDNQDIMRGSRNPSTILTNKFFKFPDSYFSSPNHHHHHHHYHHHHHHHDCHNSWFGSDISSPGDLDQDGFDDIIIGAPYEGSGVIYIHRGSKQGILETPSQKISSISFFQSGIHSFGHSFTPSRIDFDSNGFPDVVVGCYRSDVVVVLRSRPVIDLHATLTHEPVQLNANCSASEEDEYCFVLDVCMSYSIRSHDNTKDSTKLELDLSLEQENVDQSWKTEAYFKSRTYSKMSKDASPYIKMKQYKRRIRLISHKKSECFQVPVFVKNVDMDNTYNLSLWLKYKMISFSKLSPSILHSPSSNFVYLNPMLSEDTSKGNLLEVKLQKSCGNGYKCRSNLNVWGFMELSKDAHGTYLLKINSVDEIKLFVQVRNLGEDAHNSRLIVSVKLPFIGFEGQHHCHPGSDDMVTCDLGNPMIAGDEVTVVLRFDVRGIGEDIDEINIVLVVNTTSIETDPDDDVDNIDVQVIVEVDFSLLGLSVPTEVFYKEHELHEITHKYEIKNIGDNVATNIFTIVDWPNANMADHLRFPIIKIETEGRGHCFVNNNKTVIQSASSRYKRNLNPLRDFFKNYLSEPNNKKGNLQRINCSAANSWKCLQIECHFSKELKVDESFAVVIHSIVTPTSTKRTSEFEKFEMKSNARINFKGDTKIQLVDLDNDKAEVSTFIYLDNSKSNRLKIPIWILISSTCLGIMSLIVITSLLYKCGFFKRKKHKGKQFEKNQLNQNIVMQVLSGPSKNDSEADDK